MRVLNNSTGGKYERYEKHNWDEFTTNEKKILRLRKGTDLSRQAIADRVGVSGAFVTKIIEANQWLVTEWSE